MLLAMAPSIATQVPQYLVQMAMVEINRWFQVIGIQDKALSGNFLHLVELVVELAQKVCQLDFLLFGAIAAVQLKYILDHLLHALHIITDDLQHALAGRIVRFVFLQ